MSPENSPEHTIPFKPLVIDYESDSLQKVRSLLPGYKIALLAGDLVAAMALLTASRGFLVHVIFTQWLRQRFRGQAVIAGSDQEANNIVNHIIEHNAPFWIVGTVGPDAECGLQCSVPKRRLGAIEQLPVIISQFKIDDIKIHIDNFCGLPMIRLCSQKNTWLFNKLKHGIDALISLVIFILQSPLFLAMDFNILFETIFVVLGKKGAY